MLFDFGPIMKRKNIELTKGAILPLKRGLFGAAMEKLLEAAAGIKQIQGAEDRIAYEAGWTRFVDSIEEFWVRFFDEGKERFSTFQPWAGSIEKVRKEDELLRYLYQARHQSQHGRIALDWTEGKLDIALVFSGCIKGLRIFDDETYVFDATPLAGSEVEAVVTHSPGSPQLPMIHNRRHKHEFPPPQTHLSKSCEGVSPEALAEMAFRFYDGVLANALTKFQEATHSRQVKA